LSAEDLLARLVGFPSVVGRSNKEIVDFVCDYFSLHGVRSHRLMGPEGDRENIFASIGPIDRPGYILSGHMDVVPANEPQWQGDPFVLRRDGSRLIGRGACDMKGFVAAILSVVPDLMAMDLHIPIHFALSYDEENGGRGAPHMIRRIPDLCALPKGCLVGEPSNLVPVLRHKGKTALRFVAEGRSGHSSRTDLGLNAIHLLRPVIDAAVDAADAAKNGPLDLAFEPPWSTLQIGVIRGGEAINIIPDQAELLVEARAIAGVSPDALLEPVRAAAPNHVRIEELSSYPPLMMKEDDPVSLLFERLTGRMPLAAVSYGTEAGLFQQAGIPTVICGPGDIARAHKPEEFLTYDELIGARDLILRLTRSECVA
jgi:acetylornithine deacetylase